MILLNRVNIQAFYFVGTNTSNNKNICPWNNLCFRFKYKRIKTWILSTLLNCSSICKRSSAVKIGLFHLCWYDHLFQHTHTQNKMNNWSNYLIICATIFFSFLLKLKDYLVNWTKSPFYFLYIVKSLRNILLWSIN